MLIPRRRQLHLEDIRLGGAESFAARQFRQPRFGFRWHCHPEVELTLIIKGRGQRFVGDAVEEFGPGDLCLLGGNVPHSWYSAPGTAASYSLVIQFLPALWGQSFLQLPELRPIQKLLDRARRGLAIEGRTRRAASGMIHDLFARPPGSARRITELLDILALLARSGECRPLAGSPAPHGPRLGIHKLLGRVLHELHRNPAEMPRQERMARFAGLAPSAFSRFFKRQMGKTYCQYINDCRISRTCRLLVESDQSITGIALAAGFKNVSNFNRQFKAARGVTPRAYRADCLLSEPRP